MSDCSTKAWNAPRGIDGAVHWQGGTESELHYARFVNGEERKAEYVEIDGDEFVKIVRCRDCRAMRVKYGNTGIECWMNGEPFTVEPDGFCAWAKRKEGGE